MTRLSEIVTFEDGTIYQPPKGCLMAEFNVYLVVVHSDHAPVAIKDNIAEYIKFENHITKEKEDGKD